MPYGRNLTQSGRVEVVAVADPSERNRGIFKQLTGIDSLREFSDWREMLREVGEFHGAVVATPNYVHVEPALAVLERGLPLALEKPLATTPADCERILEARENSGGRILLGFVLRSTPFYKKIHEWISSGKIGRLVAVDADELVGMGVSSLNLRSAWRRWEKFTGGFLLEKCCHDMDLLNWICGGQALQVNSFGGNRIFSPNPSLPDGCDDCDVSKTCLYYEKPNLSEHEDEGEEILQRYVETGRCVYNIDKDIADAQTVQIQFSTGVLVNFLLSMNAAGPRAARNFHAIGLRGRIWGNFHEGVVYHYDNASAEVTEFKVEKDGSGHGGGDRSHALELVRMMDEPDYTPAQGAEAGYESAAICFAAERSRKEGRRMTLRQSGEGRITIE